MYQKIPRPDGFIAMVFQQRIKVITPQIIPQNRSRSYNIAQLILRSHNCPDTPPT